MGCNSSTGAKPIGVEDAELARSFNSMDNCISRSGQAPPAQHAQCPDFTTHHRGVAELEFGLAFISERPQQFKDYILTERQSMHVESSLSCTALFQGQGLEMEVMSSTGEFQKCKTMLSNNLLTVITSISHVKIEIALVTIGALLIGEAGISVMTTEARCVLDEMCLTCVLKDRMGFVLRLRDSALRDDVVRSLHRVSKQKCNSTMQEIYGNA